MADGSLTSMRTRLVSILLAIATFPVAAQPTPPFGPPKDQADRQQQWLQQRLTTVLPALMKQHGIDMWVVPMREYNEDPVFTSLVSPTTFAARRRTIYVFFDPCGPGGSSGCTKPIERIAL